MNPDTHRWECTKVPKVTQECRDKTIPDCKDVPKIVEKPVSSTECKEECTPITREVCKQVDKEECVPETVVVGTEKVPEEVCY